MTWTDAAWLTASVAVFIAFISVAVLVLTYAERKALARIQQRIGPMRTGPFGLLQPVADAMKLLTKEDLLPGKSDKLSFWMAPLIVFVPAFMLWVTVPFTRDLAIRNLELGAFYFIAVSGLSVTGILMAGWSSGNKYSLMGGLRAAGQLIAYELPLVLAVVGVVILAGTMSLDGIVQAQISWFSEAGWAFGMPFVIVQAVGLGVFFVASLAELSRIPFDMPIAESELVMGYLTEYSGFRFLFFFLAEFANMFTLSAIAATLFLGGYWVPGIPDALLQFVGPLVLLGKIALFVFISIWIRWTFPRFREDQLQSLAWKWLVPISLANIVVTGVLKVVL